MTAGSSSTLDPGQLLKMLLVREHARADAWLRKDRRALEALLAPDYIEINTRGRFDRAGVLETLFPLLTIRVFAISEPRLQLGPDADRAVLTYRCYEELVVGEQEVKGMFRVTAQYRKHKTQWQLARWEIAAEQNAGS
ncbi:MAG: hypothetical protein CVV30_02490 [Methanomicrobiales archaeon HGW-Methanomicrobiales-1]|jgi:hypothetical protein|nr:MAG: hypothetical protein CVV30_02490 [Methanomicrobiales archaeon HGW-Methanomicrobiales-1]